MQPTALACKSKVNRGCEALFKLAFKMDEFRIQPCMQARNDKGKIREGVRQRAATRAVKARMGLNTSRERLVESNGDRCKSTVEKILPMPRVKYSKIGAQQKAFFTKCNRDSIAKITH